MSDIQAIKYRLVGAVVIVVGFAVIWWLMLDHEAHRRVKEEQADLPAQTFEIERFDIEEPKPLGIRGQEASGENKQGNVEEISTESLPSGVISPQPDEMPAEAAASGKDIAPAPDSAKAVTKVEEPVAKPVAKVDKAPEPAVASKPAEPVKPAPKAAVTAPVAKPGSFTALDSKGLPESWVIQLASVKSRENAQQLQRKLLASSYPAYVKSVTTPEGVLHRVLVGPKLNRQKAEETARAIEKEFGIKGMIVRFQTGYEQ